MSEWLVPEKLLLGLRSMVRSMIYGIIISSKGLLLFLFGSSLLYYFAGITSPDD